MIIIIMITIMIIVINRPLYYIDDIPYYAITLQYTLSSVPSCRPADLYSHCRPYDTRPAYLSTINLQPRPTLLNFVKELTTLPAFLSTLRSHKSRLP